jgi:hypothetical protein
MHFIQYANFARYLHTPSDWRNQISGRNGQWGILSY